MNATLEQIKPETVELLEKQAAKFGLSVDDYLRRLLPTDEQNLALKDAEFETDQPENNGTYSSEERETKRQKSIAWITSHRKEYGGKYVALDGDRVIGIGERYGDALKLALQAGYKKAFIGHVLPLNYEGYMGGWD